MSQLLQNLIVYSEYIQKLMPYAQISITDTEKYVHAVRGDNFFLEVFSDGHVFLDGSLAKQTITTGQSVTRMGNKQLTGGIPYQGTCVPLREDGQLIGAICMFYPTANREAVQTIAEDIGATVEELHATLETFQTSMEALSQVANAMDKDSAMMSESGSKIRQMTEFIAEVSAQTRLLGLNAAIEAAHSQENGAGFSVIASEVRRLASNVTNSVGEVKTVTDNLENIINQVRGQIGDVFRRIQEGNEVTGAFSDISKNLVELSVRMQELAQVIKI